MEGWSLEKSCRLMVQKGQMGMSPYLVEKPSLSPRASLPHWESVG